MCRGSVGNLLVLVAMAIFGSYALFLRLLPGIPTLVFLFSFQVVGAIALAVTIRSVGLATVRAHLPMLAGLALVALANDLLYFAAFRTTSVANAAIAHQSVSLFLLALAPLMLDERTRRSEWVALGISLLGFAVLYARGIGLSDVDDLRGITFGVLSGLFYAFLIVLYRTIPSRGLPIRSVNLWRYVISTAVLLPFLPFIGVGSVTTGDLLPLAAFALVFAVVATGVHGLGISRTRSLHASIVGKTEPVFATVYALLFLGEVPTVQTLAGGALILGSSLWLTLARADEHVKVRAT